MASKAKTDNTKKEDKLDDGEGSDDSSESMPDLVENMGEGVNFENLSK